MSACFDEGVLQAYADGELGDARAGEVAAHVQSCPACAAAADEAADHFALLSSALDPGDALNVPTERLRARIDAAIAGSRPARAARHSTLTSQAAASSSFVERLRALPSSLAAGFATAPRQATAFASLLVAAVLIATIFYVFRPQPRGPRADQSGAGEIAKVNPPTSAAGSAAGEGGANDAAAGGGENRQAGGAGGGDKGEGAGVSGPGVRRPATGRAPRPAAGPAGFINASYVREGGKPASASRPGDGPDTDQRLLPVERPYASAVASLKSSIDQQGALSLTPTLRAEYERGIAVADRAIAASRAAARRDPADRDAQGFLRTAYEDKLELLRTVADQTQLASIGRR
jgi:hypothetical protein